MKAQIEAPLLVALAVGGGILAARGVSTHTSLLEKERSSPHYQVEQKFNDLSENMRSAEAALRYSPRRYEGIVTDLGYIGRTIPEHCMEPSSAQGFIYQALDSEVITTSQREKLETVVNEIGMVTPEAKCYEPGLTKTQTLLNSMWDEVRQGYLGYRINLAGIRNEQGWSIGTLVLGVALTLGSIGRGTTRLLRI